MANARDLAKDRSLTRAEVTFYCKDIVPSDKFMEDALQRVTKYVPSTLVYSTPFADTWKAYCDAMLHSLVVVDRTRDVGLIVYTYNEMTKNISGQFVEHWSEKDRLAILKVERTVVQILPHALSPMVVSTAGTKEVKKRIHSCYKKLV